MFRLFNCIVAEHDLVLVGLAALICAATVVSAFTCYTHALHAGHRHAMWIAFTGASAASGMWATHFVAMLAFNTPLPVGYEPGLTFASFILAAVACMVGFGLCSRGRTGAIVVGGGVIGGGIAAMHFTGMAAIEVAGSLTWDWLAVAASLVLGTGLAVLAMLAFHAHSRRHATWVASGLMVLAICILHFMAMSAVTIVPDPTRVASTFHMDRLLLALAIAALTVFGLAAGIVALTIEGLRGRIAGHLRRLEAEVAERRRAEQALRARQDGLYAQQGTIAALMSDETIRSGSLDEAMRRLTKALCLGLGIDRSGIILLDRARQKAVRAEVYVAASDSFVAPPSYGSAQHLSVLHRTSSTSIVAVDDTGQDAALADFEESWFKEVGICSAMHAPVFASGELVGFMTCTNVTRKVAWTAEQRLFAQGISSLAALVVERQQRLEIEAAATASAAKLARQQELLNNLIGVEQVRSGDLEDMFSGVTSALCQEMKADRVSVRLFGHGGERHVVSEYFFTEQHRETAVPRQPDRPYPARLAAVLKQCPIVVEDCASDPLTRDIYPTLLAPRRIRAMLHAAIRNGEEVIGIVACSKYETPHTWQPEDILLAVGVANVVALAAERRLRLNTEQSLREANHAAQEASRAKSLFLANMSHEIRTPMNGVLGMTDLLIRSGLSERQLRLAGTISDSARSLLTIINDILDLSRIEGGKLELETVDFDLAGCIEDSVELLAEQAHKKGLELNLFIDEAAAGTVTGDAVRLRQVLVNLIGNAIKFTGHGEVCVHVGLGAEDGCEGIRFTVRDTGIGIDPLMQTKLFQPFTQADTSITRRFGGTGLGLSISRYLVELMGGRMSIDSAPGKGTSIGFVLPLSIRCGGQGERGGGGRLGGRRVLVVDDNATNREIVSSYLAASGAVIEVADSAVAALERLQAGIAADKPFELAIVDLVMREVDGMELVRRIKAAPALSSLRVIMLSSLSWSGDASEVHRAGIERLLHKPIRRSDLIASAMACLSGGGEAYSSGRVDAVEAPAASPLLGLKVLVAEDNPVNQVVAEEYLANLGCEVTLAENGLQALAVLERQAVAAPFDVILMDCQMPEMDGYSATLTIRERERATGVRPIPIIAVTANAYDADRQRCLEVGMNGYLSKPYAEAELAAILGVHCQPAHCRQAEAPSPVRTGAAQVQAGSGAVEIAGKTRKAAVKAKGKGKGKVRGKVGNTAAGAAAKAKRPAGAATAKAQPALPDGPAAASELSRIVSVRPDLRSKLQQAFRMHTPGLMRALRQGLLDGDATAVSLAAHSLKSSSANVGETEVSGCCLELEVAARAGELERCAALVARVEALLAAFDTGMSDVASQPAQAAQDYNPLRRQR